MTRIGTIGMIVLMALALIGMNIGAVSRKKGEKISPHSAPGRDGRQEKAGKELPTVTGEPVVLRTAGERYVSCRASMEISTDTLAQRGFDPYSSGELNKAKPYLMKELAYLMADQALDKGAITFTFDDSGTLQASMKVMIEEGGAC